MSKYSHLQAEERAVILMQLSAGASLRSIGKLLHRSPSTVSREVHRNTTINKEYSAVQAAQRYKTIRKHSVRTKKLIAGNKLYQHVINCLIKKQWSPEQISGNLKQMNPDNPNMQVSSETIYAAIYAHPRNELKKLMISNLRRSKSKWEKEK